MTVQEQSDHILPFRLFLWKIRALANEKKTTNPKCLKLPHIPQQYLKAILRNTLASLTDCRNYCGFDSFSGVFLVHSRKYDASH